MPKTRAGPDVGRTMPSSTLTVVVLPAPFLPKRPQIAPRGTRKSTPASACTLPYAFRRSAVSMMSSSATLSSRFAESRELRLEQAADLVVAQASCPQLFDGLGDERLRTAKFVGIAVPRACLRSHECAGALAQLADAFALELAIRFRDRVRVDHELLGQRPNARQLIPGPQRSDLDGVLHLLHELEVDRHAQGRIRLDDHRCSTVLQY